MLREKKECGERSDRRGIKDRKNIKSRVEREGVKMNR